MNAILALLWNRHTDVLDTFSIAFSVTLISLKATRRRNVNKLMLGGSSFSYAHSLQESGTLRSQTLRVEVRVNPRRVCWCPWVRRKRACQARSSAEGLTIYTRGYCRHACIIKLDQATPSKWFQVSSNVFTCSRCASSIPLTTGTVPVHSDGPCTTSTASRLGQLRVYIAVIGFFCR